MRYQPKATKSCVCTQRSSQRTTTNAVTAETTVPSTSRPHSVGGPLGWRTACTVSSAPAASSVGTPTRNENSVAAGRVSPSSIAIMIVAADREVPGNTAASSWASPTTTATAHVTSRRAGRRPRSAHSIARISTPPIRVAHAIGAIAWGREKPSRLTTRPPTPVMTNASSSFST